MTIIAINAMILEGGRLSGIAHYTIQLADWFVRISRKRRAGHRIIVICRPEARRYFAAIEGLEVMEVPISGGRVARVLTEQFYLPLLLRRYKVDAVVNPAFTGPVYGARTIVTTVHDLYFRVVPELMPRAQRMFLSAFVPYCCRRSTNVVTTSASTMRDLERFYPDLAGRITVVPMANRLAGPATLPDRAVMASAAPFVLIVAALTGNKNPGPLVEAVAIARRQHPDLTLVHVGQDPDLRLADAVARYDAGEWVSSRTGVSDVDLAKLYGQCLCVAIPSLCEGFGLPLLEAQAFGAPVIASDRSALPEVGGEEGALYFDPTDHRQIADAITTLIRSPERREALRRSGFINQARFTWKRTAEGMLALLVGAGNRNEMA
jgi:glycosyltransferase involved in cell wall biosynthesis